jgi:hypothetical protein
MNKPPLEREIRRVLREFSFGSASYIQQKIDGNYSTAEIGRVCSLMSDAVKDGGDNSRASWRLKDDGR